MIGARLLMPNFVRTSSHRSTTAKAPGSSPIVRRFPPLPRRTVAVPAARSRSFGNAQRFADAAPGAVEQHEERAIADAGRRAVRARFDEASHLVRSQYLGWV